MNALGDPIILVALILLGVAVAFAVANHMRGRSPAVVFAPPSPSNPAADAIRTFDDEMARLSREARARIVAEAQAKIDLQRQAETLYAAAKLKYPKEGESPKE